MEIIAAPAEKNTKNSAAFGQFQFQQNKKSSQNSLRRQYSANNYSQEQVTQSADSKVLKKSHSSDEESETNSIDDGGSLGIKSDYDETELEGKDAVVPLLQTASDSVLERPTTPNSVAEKVSKGVLATSLPPGSSILRKPKSDRRLQLIKQKDWCPSRRHVQGCSAR